MNEEQTSYKVTDRRLFNPDGTPREVPESERPEPTPVKPETASATAGATPESQVAEAGAAGVGGAPSPQTPTPASASKEPESGDLAPDAEEADSTDADDPASFASFLMSIASNAAASLGMMEHPVTRKREVDLELGKHWIDVLGMLQKKTAGNVTSQEKRMLEGLLSDLRMQYVSLVNSPQQARKFSGSDITGGR